MALRDHGNMRMGVARLACKQGRRKGEPHHYFWHNTAFPHTAGTRFIVPASLATHGGPTTCNWPVQEGVDFSWRRIHADPKSRFAYQCAYDFFGAYDVDGEYGLVAWNGARAKDGGLTAVKPIGETRQSGAVFKLHMLPVTAMLSGSPRC